MRERDMPACLFYACCRHIIMPFVFTAHMLRCYACLVPPLRQLLSPAVLCAFFLPSPALFSLHGIIDTLLLAAICFLPSPSLMPPASMLRRCFAAAAIGYAIPELLSSYTLLIFAACCFCHRCHYAPPAIIDVFTIAARFLRHAALPLSWQNNEKRRHMKMPDALRCCHFTDSARGLL